MDKTNDNLPHSFDEMSKYELTVNVLKTCL